MTATWRVQTKCNAISYCCHWLHAFSTLGVDPATTVQFKLYSDRGVKQFEFFQFGRNVCLQRMKWLVSGLRVISLIHRGHSFKLHGSKTKTIRDLHISHNAPHIVFNSLRGRRLEVFGRKKERARERETREGRGSACPRGPIDLAQTNRTAKKRCTFISSVLIYLL